MDDLPLQKIAISGPTIASIIQRFSFSPGAVDGLLFGHVTHFSPSNLSDDDPSSSSSSPSSSTPVATVTGFLCSGTSLSFYDSSGLVDPLALRRLLGGADLHHPQHSLIGWFSGRRKTHIRPSLREFSVTASLSSNTQLSIPVKNASIPNSNFSPCVFLLLASPLQDQTIHTHEYRAYQFRTSTASFDPKSIDIVNIGPAFRGHYGSFCPNSPFPILPCELRTSPMSEDQNDASSSLGSEKQVSKDQRELDMCAEGFDVGRLSRLVGLEAVNYTSGLEELYSKMLKKVESLARLVEKSSARVLEQEHYNRKLRYKVARSPALE